MSALGQADCKIAEEGLRTAKLGGLESSYQRRDDRDLQRLTLFGVVRRPPRS